MPTSEDDRERPPKIIFGGWEFNRYRLPPSNYPAVERYRLATTDGMAAYVELDHGGSWRVHLYPGPADPDRTAFAPANAYVLVTDALAVLVCELNNRGCGGSQ